MYSHLNSQHSKQMLFSTFSNIKIGSIPPTMDPFKTFLFLLPPTQYFQKALDFLLESIVLLQMQDISEGHQFLLFSVFLRSHLPSTSTLCQTTQALLLKKRKVPCFHVHYILIISLRPKKKSQFCCLFLHQGQLFTKNYTKAVDLLHETQVARALADLGWQGNNTYPSPSPITLGCQLISCQTQQKQQRRLQQ